MRRSGIFLLCTLLLCGSPLLAQFHQIPCPIATNYINTSSSWDINTYQPCEIEVNGSFVNNGVFRNTGGGVLLNNGWIFSFGPYFDNLADGSIINNGTLYNSYSFLRNWGNFTNTAAIANYAGFINNGSLANTGNFDNLGYFLNSATFDNQAFLSSSGLIDDYGTLTNHNSGVLLSTNSFAIESAGVVDNAGSIINLIASGSSGQYNLEVPYAGYHSLKMSQNNANGNYNSLQTSFSGNLTNDLKRLENLKPT